MAMLELIAIFLFQMTEYLKNYISPLLCVRACACVCVSTMVCRAEAKGQLAEIVCFVLFHFAFREVLGLSFLFLGLVTRVLIC